MSDPSPRLPSAAQPLFILAMDHRDSFGRTLFGVKGEPSSEDLRRMRDAKSLVFDAVRHLGTTDLAGGGKLGILIDERLGADVAYQVRDAGFQLAMPVELSGAPRFDFEYGDAFGRHIEDFNPDWVKALVRFNPDDPAELRQAQTAGLRRLHDWVAGAGRRWILELLVPPTRPQLAAHDDQTLFDEHERPRLTARVILDLCDLGVHPDIWKLEGYETVEGAQQVLDVLARRPKPPSCCIVLGRNAPIRQVDHWLDIAAPLQGFAGFAVGRSIWEDPLADYLNGHIDRDQTESHIAQRYTHFVHEYLQADSAPHRQPGEPRTEPFTFRHPRLTPDREVTIRQAAGNDPRSLVPAWMVRALLAEVDALREGAQHLRASHGGEGTFRE